MDLCREKALIGKEVAMDILLEKGAGVDEIGDSDSVILKTAIESGQVMAVVELLDWNARAGVPSGGFKNALESGAWFGDVEMVNAIMAGTLLVLRALETL